MAFATPQPSPRLDVSVRKSTSRFINASSHIGPQPPPPTPNSDPEPLPPEQHQCRQQQLLFRDETADLHPAPLPPAIAVEPPPTTAPAPSASLFGQSAVCLPVLPRKKVGGSLPQGSETVIDKPDRFDVDASSDEHSAAPQAGAVETCSKVSKPAWRKPLVDAEEPGPVMGAVSWPALGEARTRKSSELSKPISSPASIQKSSPKPPSTSVGRETFATQSSSSEPSFRSWAGGARQKPSITRGMLGNSMSPSRANAGTENSNESLNGLSATGAHLVPSHRLVKGSGETRMKDIQESAGNADNGRVFHHRGKGRATPLNKNAGHRRNSMWGQGRENLYWHPHGSVYADTWDNGFALQQQGVGLGNLPLPFHPFMNINPAFLQAAELYNAGGGIYFVPATAPDSLHGAAYDMPPGSPGVAMYGPDGTALQLTLVKQIEYYFSIDNLCSDTYLRSHMDYQGFVPVSLIASFNRVQMLTSKSNVILEAMRKSTIVEVQGNRLRRRGDWERWLLDHRESASRNSEAYHHGIFLGNPGKNRKESVKSSIPMKKAEDGQSFLDRAADEHRGAFLTSSVPLSEENSEPHFWERTCASSFTDESCINMSEGKSSDGCGQDKLIGRVINLGIEAGSNSSSLQPEAKCDARNGCAHDTGNCSPSYDGRPLTESSKVSHLVAKNNTGNLTTERQLSISTEEETIQ